MRVSNNTPSFSLVIVSWMLGRLFETISAGCTEVGEVGDVAMFINRLGVVIIVKIRFVYGSQLTRELGPNRIDTVTN